MPPRLRFFGACCALLIACGVAACNLDNPGDAPPRATLYFPNGLALSPPGADGKSRFLYVVNSDFDLRYNAGSVQAYSLDGIDEKIAGCASAGEKCRIDPSARGVWVDEVPIAPFSTGLTSTPSGDRLLITTRTSDNLPFVRANPDADGDDVLTCDAGGVRCGLEAEPGSDRFEDDEDLDWPVSPVSVAAGYLSAWTDPDAEGDPASEYALVAHRNGQVSLFVEDGDDLVMTDVRPRLAPGATDLAYDAQSGFVYATEYIPVQTRALARFAVEVPVVDGAPRPLEAYVYDAGAIALQPVENFHDTRGIAFLPPLKDQGTALATPNALIAAQNPSSLLLADVTGADGGDRGTNLPRIGRVKGMTELGLGASRVAAAVVEGIPIALVASFDARELALIDLRTMVTRSVVPNLSGPLAVVIDAARARVYCTDVRSSVIRVLDIAPALDPDDADPVEVVATLGTPRVLQELR